MKNSGETVGDSIPLQRGATYKSGLLGWLRPLLLGLATIQRNGGFRTDSDRTYGGDASSGRKRGQSPSPARQGTMLSASERLQVLCADYLQIRFLPDPLGPCPGERAFQIGGLEDPEWEKLPLALEQFR